MTAQVSKELPEPWHSGAHIHSSQYPAGKRRMSWGCLGLFSPAGGHGPSCSSSFLDSTWILSSPCFGFSAQPTLPCVEPEQPTGSQLCPSGDGDEKPAFPPWQHIPEKPHTPRVLPAGSGETSCLLPAVSFPGTGKVLGKFFPRAPSWLRSRPWNNAWKGGWEKNSQGWWCRGSCKQQQCIVCGGSVLELFPTEIWIGLGSPAHRLGSSQLSVLDSHSLVTSFPTPGCAFPKEISWSPPWLFFQGMFPKKHLLEPEIPSPARHHGTPHPESPIPVLGLQVESVTSKGFWWLHMGEMELLDRFCPA